MILRFYVHNFRCLENFELPIRGLPSALLIGKNGTGKTTVALALQILQSIARGTNRVGDLLKREDFTRGHTDVPVRFEIEAELSGKVYSYIIAFELPRDFKEPRVFEERLAVAGPYVYSRELSQVRLKGKKADANFQIDWHLVALPIIQEQSEKDPLFIFKQWLARMLILRPIPMLIRGDSEAETLEPNSRVTNFGAWFSGVLASAPAAYSKIEKYLQQVIPDLKDIKNPVIAANSRRLVVQFSSEQGSMSLPFEDLSDGEKCFMICALVLAMSEAYGPVVCFWDEPDNYLALSEVGHFVTALRAAFRSRGQFIATSHNDEAIRSFSNENTIVLYRRNHFEPTLVRPLSEFQVNGDLINVLIRGDLEP